MYYGNIRGAGFPPQGMDPETFRLKLGKTKEEMIAMYGEPQTPQPLQQSIKTGSFSFNINSGLALPTSSLFGNGFASAQNVSAGDENVKSPNKGKGPAELAKALGISQEKLQSMSPKDVEKLAREKGVDLKDYGRPDQSSQA